MLRNNEQLYAVVLVVEVVSSVKTLFNDKKIIFFIIN